MPIPQVGEQAPAFEALDQHGTTHRLQEYAGRKVALYFYPKDDTSGCTAQACDLRDNYQSLQAAGIQVLGVSIDSEKSHKKFAEKYELPFPLLVDEDKKLVEDYGVWQEKSMYGRKYMGTMRYTFLIDETGKIEKVITKVDTKNHAAQLMSL
ncbi:thioredoxin-dependent thiol peroxidase [Microvirga sp. STR05]|uniref:thioredoxin-dependent peroxiredoxin n=2 Tax=Hymenobacter TaxID=89966 RepID=A0A7G7WBF9_9BACT|nr:MULTISPECIES: thioredoxin-dependent thiol peroxidase [Hymenobacter]MBD2716237.1 thioredoxin-dependent thiol peroxidase [Hymenobacter duratus]MBR7951151.1 thioredoxin-dependent thiol peroxidase [Microvirga sp. STR05]QNH63702.1 thioredoxin-dependent thiol peroxidase [Hymenobacter sediminicola]